jgi:hypothetical protein
VLLNVALLHNWENGIQVFLELTWRVGSPKVDPNANTIQTIGAGMSIGNACKSVCPDHDIAHSEVIAETMSSSHGGQQTKDSIAGFKNSSKIGPFDVQKMLFFK